MEDFDIDADANELGVHTLLGGVVTCFPPAGVPDTSHFTRRIWRELDNTYVPLWVTNVWRSPNGGHVKVHHLAVGSYVPEGDDDRVGIKGLLMPRFPVHGRLPKNPIAIVDILDGLTDEERNFGELPRWQPLTEQALEWGRYFAWRDRNVEVRRQFESRNKADDAATKRLRRSIGREQKARRADKRFDILKSFGRASRTFGPSKSFGTEAA